LRARPVASKDARGLHYIAHLLHHPHQEFHAITLASAGATLDGETTGVGSAQSPNFSLDHTEAFGDAGDTIDLQARGAYKQRLTELRAQLAEAQQFNDLGQVEKLRLELEFLTQELAHSLGLGGRTRKSASVAERARTNVTKAIKLALRKINKHHSALDHHLATTIKTGAYCSYTPDVRIPTVWQS
jgi:hypothetical protein